VTTRDHEHVIARFYNDMWNRFDTNILPDIVSPTLQFRGSLGQTRVGIEQFIEYVTFVQTFAPDFHNSVVDTISDDHRTFARLTYTGTHQGELFGIAPTGHRFEYAGAAIFAFDHNLISNLWVLGDIHGLIQQLAP
jgi:predicted ester cyclase